MKMTKEKWHTRYKARLMKVGGLSEKDAEANLQAGMSSYKYDIDPENLADDEMSYWPGDAI